ncbi:iron ABC transporter permease [Prosthecochloris sp. N3]|uniref:Iron ABC transporter permease n=1 Tax=Prosthecochloris ethylica TaxID=2743976 RepID=A0ABR9XSB0_9CHLB|nr:iron ABC transporter permease [Prosthecochloris ethylica]MBF0585328.1 iron ABC transporter permease [Prosthecochloris ethylica]MBF0636864.1 iron ABC transporter permease [Prosthecochloris ethylica]NUK46557.1 iron ABC transporter permease [Prosthecochloris ethylica]
MTRNSLMVSGCVLLLLVAAVFSLQNGRYPVSGTQLLSLLMDGRSEDPHLHTVIYNIRLPRIIAAIAVGGALSLAGAAYQGMFRNPMVSPDILGVSSGAGFGAALAILLSLPVAGVQASAFAGGMLAVVLAISISRSIGRHHNAILVLVLSGIIISALFSALISLAKFSADPENRLPAITFWLMGSLADIRLQELPAVLALVAAGSLPILLSGWRLNVLSFGEDEAQALGIHTSRVRMIVIGSATLVTASVIALSGLIGWIGLVIPHAARMISGPDHRVQLPVSFLLGGIALLVFDNIARSVSPSEIPIGIITALAGAPFFIVLLKLTSRKTW